MKISKIIELFLDKNKANDQKRIIMLDTLREIALSAGVAVSLLECENEGVETARAVSALNEMSASFEVLAKYQIDAVKKLASVDKASKLKQFTERWKAEYMQANGFCAKAPSGQILEVVYELLESGTTLNEMFDVARRAWKHSPTVARQEFCWSRMAVSVVGFCKNYEEIRTEVNALSEKPRLAPIAI